MNQNRRYFLRLHRWPSFLRRVGLVAIALFTFHGVSSLVFSVVDLAPSNPKWSLGLTLAGFLALAGTAMGLQSLRVMPLRLTGIFSGAASVGILLFYSVGQMTDQNPTWAIGGAGLGLVTGGGLGFWSGGRPGFWQTAIALTSTLCTYGLVFGLSAWTFAAISANHGFLSLGLGALTLLYLWFTRRSLTWIAQSIAKWKN